MHQPAPSVEVYDPAAGAVYFALVQKRSSCVPPSRRSAKAEHGPGLIGGAHAAS